MPKEGEDDVDRLHTDASLLELIVRKLGCGFIAKSFEIIRSSPLKVISCISTACCRLEHTQQTGGITCLSERPGDKTERKLPVPHERQ